jgi:cytochrome c peroxidase
LIGKKDATFTDNKFHNIGVGLPDITPRLGIVANSIIQSKIRGTSIDHSVLSAEDISHLGRFVITLNPIDIGNFRTPSLRNVALTAPYMHDGSLKTLDEVVTFYGKGGVHSTLQHPTIRNLRLTKPEERQLVDFMQALTSTKLAASANVKSTGAADASSTAGKPDESKLQSAAR